MWVSVLAFLRTTGQVILALPTIIAAVKQIVDAYHAQKTKRREEALVDMKNAKTLEEKIEANKKYNSNI